jgi:hypothetical protein
VRSLGWHQPSLEDLFFELTTRRNGGPS